MKQVEYVTKSELRDQVNEMLPQATVAQYRWIYCYLKDLDEWPIVTDYVSPTEDVS